MDTQNVKPLVDPLRVVAAIVEDNGEYLACRRAPGKSAAGQWEFPGGKIEVGESDADALVREILEELNVSITVMHEFSRDLTFVGAKPIELICLRARLDSERPRASTDHDKIKWVKREELEDLNWASPDLPAVHLLTRVR